MQEASLLGNMVRLADIMMVEGVVAWGVGSAEQLLGVLESSKLTSESKQSRVGFTMRFGSATKVLAKRMLKYWGLSESDHTIRSGLPVQPAGF